MENRQSEACKLTYSVSTPSRCLERGGASKAGPGGPTRVRACSGGGGHGGAAESESGTGGTRSPRPVRGDLSALQRVQVKPRPLSHLVTQLRGRGGPGGQSSHCVTQPPPPHPPPGGSSVVLTRLFNAHRGREVLLSASPPRGGLRLGRLTGLFGRVEVIERGPFHAGLQMCPFQCSRLYHHGNLRATTGSQAGAIFILGPLTPGGRTAGKVPKPPWGVRG